MTEDAKKVWQVMENEFGWSNQPEDLHLEYFEDIIKATKQTLTIPVVVKSLPIQDLPNCTRVEVIDQKGRSYVNWKPTNKTELSLQDDGKTLKVFISN